MNRLREGLKAKKTLWAAGAYDALSARLIDEAGFDVVFTTGFGISASFLGQPDVELYTMTENLAVVRQIVSCVGKPVVADCDTGYGNAVNVQRTVREFEKAGVAGLVIEDQITPKTCPAIASVDITPLATAVAKIKAALDARSNPDLVIVARTDASSVDEAIFRAQAYVAAGADMIQPIDKTFANEADLRRLKASIPVPLSIPVNVAIEKLPASILSEVAGLAVFPLVPLLTVCEALRANLAALARNHTTRDLPLPPMPLTEFKSMIGFPQIEALQTLYYKEDAKLETAE
jgi:2-methylisocitrate lyase-like PEP mutase family enzyme